MANFPVEVFDRSDGAPQRWPTIGIKLSAPRHDGPRPGAGEDTIDRAIDCLQTLFNNADRYYLTPDKVAWTIFIDSTGITATDFGITPEQRATLFANGQRPRPSGWRNTRRTRPLPSECAVAVGAQLSSSVLRRLSMISASSAYLLEVSRMLRARRGTTNGIVQISATPPWTSAVDRQCNGSPPHGQATGSRGTVTSSAC